MKKLIVHSRIVALVSVVLCSVLFGFKSLPGAHSVQIYLDSKLVIDQYINFKKVDVAKLTLNPADKVQQLIVKYNECERPATGRTITIKDENNKALKSWSFGGGTGYKDPMACNVKEIFALRQNGSSALKLFYSSNELSEGQQIATVLFAGNITASK
jgi:hypothetical protein